MGLRWYSVSDFAEVVRRDLAFLVAVVAVLVQPVLFAVCTVTRLIATGHLLHHDRAFLRTVVVLLDDFGVVRNLRLDRAIENLDDAMAGTTDDDSATTEETPPAAPLYDLIGPIECDKQNTK